MGVIGQSVKRVEDQRFITGKGRYTDDIALPNSTFAALVRSPHAHAAIKGVRYDGRSRSRWRGRRLHRCRPRSCWRRRPTLRLAGRFQKWRHHEGASPSGAGRDQGAPRWRSGRHHHKQRAASKLRTPPSWWPWITKFWTQSSLQPKR